MGLNLPTKVLLPPRRQLTVELLKYALQLSRIKPGRLPQLSGGRLEERIRIQRVALDVLGRYNIKTESRANQRPACLRVGIGRQHPTLMLTVAKDIHQALQAELDVGILEVKQCLGRR